MNDAINPAHYNQGQIECIDAMEQVLTAEEYRGFLKGNAIKYLWREENKGGIEDLRKAKWYLDRLIEHCDESPIDLNKGLVKAWSCEDGKAKQVYPEQLTNPPDGFRYLEIGEVVRKGDIRFKDGLIYALEPIMIGMVCQEHWMPIVRQNRFEIGDWVKINKPKSVDAFLSMWMPSMDRFNGQIVQVTEIDGKAIIHDEWAFNFDWLEPAEAPQQPKEQPPLPEAWRFLEVGEVTRDGDRFFRHDEWKDCRFSVGDKIRKDWMPTIRRNRFEVGEKVVECVNNRIGVVKDIEAIGRARCFLYHVEMQDTKIKFAFNPNQIAPYIEDAK